MVSCSTGDGGSAQLLNFFKVLTGDFRHQLRIPTKFMSHFEAKLQDHCVLKGPSGKRWEVDLVKSEDDGWLFVNGWENFAEDHQLKPFDFVVFSYRGRSSFDVMVFDESGCNKEVCYSIDEGQSSCLHGPGECHSGGQDRAQDVNLASQTTYKLKYISNRREVTPEEKRSTYNKALEHSNNSKNAILKTMLPTNVSMGFTLKLPKARATKRIPSDCKEIVLTVEGLKEWHVGCKWIHTGQCEIRAQWRTFVWDNKLEEDGVCVFKLNPERTGANLRMKTTIFRVVDSFVRLTMKRQ